ncbi:MAG: response regulator [Bacteroidetes bacterium]|nr:response regulator [Bacteroidota bacterium]MBK7110496.1 response regulator [Bacteroidota bacterium]MBK8488276.1 response regulator [Bacteroidota bacterium]MBK8681962.1 response regulator [Bacteroidota bacterium]
MPNSQNGVMQILLVEDNPGDIRLTQEALKEGDIQNVLHVVKDGVEAMEFLRKKDKYSEMPTPDIILLDLNLPRKDGREVLADIKTDENLKMIPVIVLTTSDTDQDIIKSYKLHANCFITKPVDLELFIFIIQQIQTFWFKVIKLPPKNNNHF